MTRARDLANLADGDFGAITLSGDITMGTNQIVFDNNSQAIQIKDAAGTASYVLYQDNADTLIIGNGTNVETIRLDTSGNEGSLRINTNGNVGIGTSSMGYPSFADNLTIADSGNSGITIRSGNANEGAIYFSDDTGTSAGTYAGYVVYNHSSNIMRFATGSTDRMRIDSNGQIGVSGSTTSFDTTGAVNGLQLYYETDSGLATIGSYGGSTGSTALTFHTNSGTSASEERFRIDSSGLVGINNTSPSSQIAGAADLVIGDTSDADSGMTFVTSTSGQGLIHFSDATSGDARFDGFIGYEQNNRALKFGTAQTERMRISSDGNVHIGNTQSMYYGGLIVGDGANTRGITIYTGTSSVGVLAFADGTSGSARYAGRIEYDHPNNNMNFYTVAGDLAGQFTGTNKNFKVTAGNIIIGTDGKGIDFSAQTSSSASGVTTSNEVLTHYERGEWTAAWSTGSGSITVDNSFKAGRYERIGNVCFITLHIRASSVSTPSGVLKITGLPFSTPNNSEFRHSLGVPFFFGLTGMTNGLVPIVYLGQNSADLIIGVQSTNSITNLDASKIIANSELYITGHIHVS